VSNGKSTTLSPEIVGMVYDLRNTAFEASNLRLLLRKKRLYFSGLTRPPTESNV
jgi:hypothetical protein